jgi:hypothetical protein
MSGSGTVAQWLESVPLQREMTERHAVLWTAIILDVLSAIVVV